MAQEFLPLCDVLFNIISLAAYFCDVVFDLVTIYTLYATAQIPWFAITFGCIMTSLLTCQVMSLHWHLRRTTSTARELAVVVCIHCCQGGVLWRYFRLFVPVDLRRVKMDVRDLCVLRMVHAFCESVPLLMVQLYLIWCRDGPAAITRLDVVSTMLSLFNVCWALASFNKYVRLRHVHKLVLTWLGVLSQFMWRAGTVSSRVVVLTVYATLYGHWTFLVVALHWLTMFLWLISPKNIFEKEKTTWRAKKYVLSFVVGFVYIFSYVNLQESNAWHKIAAFYVTMLLENSLLVAVWLAHRPVPTWFEASAMAIAWGGFVVGIMFMLLYYRCFHIRRMSQKYTTSGTLSSGESIIGPFQQQLSGTDLSSMGNNMKNGDKMMNDVSQHTNGNVAYVPGVFNCRLNPALKRKKKKPTTFVPPPVTHVGNTNSGKVEPPFWKKALPVTITKSASSDQEGSSVGSRVNIQQKLQEKKQQQLQELKEIEEEIKQGKIARPRPMEMAAAWDEDALVHPQPIPRSKKRPLVSQQHVPPLLPLLSQGRCHRVKPRQRAKTPEILLSPHYLENCRVYYDYGDHQWKCGHIYYNNATSDVSSSTNLSARHHTGVKDRQAVMYKSYRIPSDLDSQVSLPRSYTLPREFRYYRKGRPRKTVRSEHFMVASTNSSDGDVDSADENEAGVGAGVGGGTGDDGDYTNSVPQAWPVLMNYRTRSNYHETKL